MKAAICPRCSAPMVPLSDLAEAARTALDAYERMKLAIPDSLRLSVKLLGERLPCHVGTCRLPSPAEEEQRLWEQRMLRKDGDAT